MKCAYCKREFTPKVAHQKFCNDTCRSRYHYKETYNEPIIEICRNCGKEFEPQTSTTKFCCRACYDEYRYKNSQKVQLSARQAAKAAKRQKFNEKPLGDYIREAAECNLDYGTYRGLIAAGKTYEELKAQAPCRQMPVHQHTPHRER